MFSFMKKASKLIPSQSTLPGRDQPMSVPPQHFVNGHPLKPPFPAGLEQAVFGMGCFWGAERLFWQRPGVYSTAVGYAGGGTKNPTYEEVCSGVTNHAEGVLVVVGPKVVSYGDLQNVFWEGDHRTQVMLLLIDAVTQYRSTNCGYGH